jgi:hypothetical protein
VIVWHEPMHEPEIVLAFTKPETEWVRGWALPKMSPTRYHARAQLLFGAALDRWAERRGEVGTEWLSIGDAGHDVADKVEVYLSAGCRLVVIIDPATRTMTLRDPTNVRILTAAHQFEHDALPEFRLRLNTFFAEALDLRA